MFHAKALSKVVSHKPIISHNRSFATATKLELPGVSGRYAASLYSAAASKGLSAKVEEEVKKFKEVLTSSPALKVYLDSPVIPKPERTQSIDTILGKLGSSDVFKSFFHALIENRRTEFTSAILDDYLKYMKHERREIDGVITTAKPLSTQELDKIKSDVLKAKFSEGDKLNLVNKVDPSLLGGHVIQIGNLYQDSSLRTEVNRIRKSLEEAVKTASDQHRSFFLSGIQKEN